MVKNRVSEESAPHSTGRGRVFRGTYDAPGDAGAFGGCAQMMGAPPPPAIGTIQTATGLVTVMDACGVVAQVKVGDPVYRHDTLETGADGAVGITFIDGTAFNLSNNARMALNEFVCDGTSNSALFSLSKGVFAFIAGKVAKAGGLRIDTPFARIRGAAQDGGIGILTLAALAFSTIREIQAASRSDAFLDDGTITYKDSPHGTFEITTRDGRVIVADDPGETIVVDPAGSVTRLPNSSSRMAELQGAQQAALATLSMGLGQQGAAPGGSSTPTEFAQEQILPINFSQLQNQGPAPLAVTITTPTNQGVIDVPLQQFKPPPPLPPTIAISTIASTIAGQISVAADNIINASKANAGVNITGTTSHVENGQIVTITIVDGSNHVVYSAAAMVTNDTWSINISSAAAKLLADGSYTLTADVSNLAGLQAQALQAITVDQDVNEHPSVLVNVGSMTPIGAVGAGQVAFTISGLETDDSGTLTFSDQAGQAVDSQGHPISTVNLSSLSDGTITSSLAVSDTAGNQFSASGNAVPLEQKLGEHTSVLVNGGSTTPIGFAGAGQVAFTISGLASDDSGALTFSDQAGHTVVVQIVNGTVVPGPHNTATTVDLSSLSDGTITSSLLATDPAGNQFNASGNGVTLEEPLTIAPGTTLTLSGDTLTNSRVVDDGTILVQSNLTSTILGDVTGSGLIQIKNNSTLEMKGSVGSLLTVLFSVDPGGGANSLLILDDPFDFHAQLSGFQGNDQIHLLNFDFGSHSFSFSGGILTIKDLLGTTVLTFTFGGSPNLKFASDGGSGTLISDPPASTTTTDASTTIAAATIATDASTATTDATVTPVAKTSTLTAAKTTSSQTKATSATVTETASGRTNATLAAVDDASV